ncbi:acetyl-CoA carboxylase biotin carboxyl carrier protein subunit [Salegentibacter sp. F188]|uniref:Acetyl-CoA carboxylase biotin carboxyl carrier protein subunit n=1 Tax=Autumnicola patrickiae TaxID=3075591 RepID=A0ABU3DZ88_9FLAO|nr:acetyl-CoA carboxylase biotin carboxyl carrier protein subunit [Salegentibacter sp. F188]MDT0689032.1 acetyl-CoA carboxylase biotin carboxyl carrier protein subunit [Salegentibacter sp. F188]
MEKKYKVRVNDNYNYKFTNDEITALDQQKLTTSKFHVLKEHHSFKAEILNYDFNQKKYSVRINSNIYEVDISNELDLLIEEMGLSLGSAQAVNDIKAPMPGLILDVVVKEGDKVKEGDYLLVLEAMKMENTLTAPGDGIIKSVHVEKGQTVDKNQLLIELE